MAPFSADVALSTPEILIWGGIGALISYLVVFLLPDSVKVARGQAQFVADPARIGAAIFIGLIFVAAGSTLTYVFGSASSVKDALAYGLGIESIMGGTLKGFGP